VNNSKELFILFHVSLIFTLSEIVRLQFEFREWRTHYFEIYVIYKVVGDTRFSSLIFVNKGNNKITEHGAIFQRERQNSQVNK
jgi:hypothetical protein